MKTAEPVPAAKVWGLYRSGVEGGMQGARQTCRLPTATWPNVAGRRTQKAGFVPWGNIVVVTCWACRSPGQVSRPNSQDTALEETCTTSVTRRCLRRADFGTTWLLPARVARRSGLRPAVASADRRLSANWLRSASLLRLARLQFLP